ncbi:MAG: nucleoside kinase [Candidatus Cloacimonetes bacterium]|nr:nucleoside kinase [Candidatus Cloacimonadota bacterium]
MFQVELTLDSEHWKTLSVAQPVTIRELIGTSDITAYRIIAYQKDSAYICSDYLLSENCRLNCISVLSAAGHLVYQDTGIFILMKAFFNILPHHKKLVVEHSVGDGVFCEVFNDYVLTSEDVKNLRKEINSIIQRKMPITRMQLSPEKAREIFSHFKRDDIVKNIGFDIEMNVYQCGKYFDYFIRQLAENTEMLTSFELIYQSPGLIIRFPRMGNLEIIDKFILPKKLFLTHQEHDKWLSILNIHNTSALNKAIKDYKIQELIQIEEALHENKIVDIANKISWNKKVRIVLIAGPTSSGKTTFAKRLFIQLRVNGIYPHVINMDDYFHPRQTTPRKDNGVLDFESIDAVNTEMLNNHLQRLLAGQEIELPKYNFLTGQTENSHFKLKLRENDILIMEGIHGLNDKLTESIPFNQKLKIYVSALNNLNIDAHNRIRTSDSRKIRRIVRDHKFRGNRAEQTLILWESIREGEDKNIFPFQENADFMFNSILNYELAVLKKYIEPLLQDISPYSVVYLEAKSLLEHIKHIKSIEDDLVPSNSIIREFIGSSAFKY